MNREDFKNKLRAAAKLNASKIDSKKLQMPSIKTQYQNIGKSIVKNVKSLVAGNSLNVSEMEKNKRLQICKSCEFFDISSERCSKCGCYMAVKTYLKAENCPIGKW